LVSDTHPKLPFNAYRGDGPYVFVSYAHEDEQIVYSELLWLHERGFNIWYDEGISPGQSWPEELAKAIQECSLFLLFVTSRSVRSENCERETTFALDARKPFLAVHLTETELPPGWKLSTGNRQAILKHRATQAAYRSKLIDAVSAAMKSAPVQPDAAGDRRSPWAKRALALLGLTAGVILALYGYRAYMDATAVAWARDEAIPEIVRLADQGSYLAAFELAGRAEAVLPDDPILRGLWDRISWRWTIDTEPSVADVSVKRYESPDTPWRRLGQTPVASRLPRADAYRFRFEKEGFESLVMATSDPNDLAGPVILSEVGTVPEGMVTIPRHGILVPIPFVVDRFFMDRYEVTNREFSEFVDSGGYDNPEYWRDFDFLINGRVVGWEEARNAFRDTTGRVGPSTWQLGRYPAGLGDHPVAGVSWYEAAAYAHYRNKSLPTLYHWWLATHVTAGPLAGYMAPFANLAGRSTQPVGESNSLGPWGTYDNAGNVREWISNEGSDGNRWILGGGWKDAQYAFTLHYELPPMDRSAMNGIRLVRYVEEVQDGRLPHATPRRVLLARAEVEARDFRNVPPVSDEGYRLLQEQFGYDPSEVTYDVERPGEADWQPWEKVTVTPRSGESFAIHLITPEVASVPRQAVIYFPPLALFIPRAPSCDEVVATLAARTPKAGVGGGNFILAGGRVFVMPVWSGSCERYDDFYGVSRLTRIKLRGEHMLAWREELGRTLDYLETRDDIASGAYGYLGLSYGGSRPLPLLALEDRLKAAVIYLGGFPHGTWPQIADPVNYASRIRLPFLMLADQFDAFRPFEISQRPLYDLVGTAEEDKKLVVYEAGHGALPIGATMREIGDWFDRYLGK
jgi:hypothetical protein